MTTLQMNVLIRHFDSSDRDSDSARSVSLHLVDSETGSDTDHYLNI